MLKTLSQYALSIGLIFLCLIIGQQIQQLFNTAIPSSIIGMLLLFSLLASGLVPSHWVKQGASVLIRYMVLLFVPISVGLMEHVDMLLANAITIIASAIGGSLIVLVSLSLSLDRWLKRRHK